MSASSADLRGVLTAAVDDALALLFPVSCAGCPQWGPPLCPDCRQSLRADPQSLRSPQGVDVCAPFVYAGVAGACLRAAKEQGRTGLLRLLAPSVGAQIRRLTPADATGVLVVPVPTRREAMRRRGYRVPDLLVRGARLPVTRALRLTRSTGDQRALSREDRLVNVAGAMRARGVEGRAVVIVDDVTTTGATIDEAARALVDAGAQVLGAVAAAATPRTHFRG